MRQVVADVPGDAAAVHGSAHVPVLKKDKVCQFPERSGEGCKEGWRHNEPKPVHWEVVMDAVEDEVSGYADSVVRHLPIRDDSQPSANTESEGASNSSMWNRHLCKPYSRNVQIAQPKSQSDAVQTGLGSP